MMLLPYMSEPATGSRIPSMSTGGAAMKATMKQMVAASKQGIISTPNQPTYKRLSVEVTQLQNCSQALVERCCERVAVIVMKELVGPSGKWWRYYAPRTLSGDMRDGLVDLPNLGQAAGVQLLRILKGPLHLFTYLS